MTTETINKVLDALIDSDEYFIQIHGEADWRDGWKLSIQGHNMEDMEFLIDRLVLFLESTKASYKFATQKLIDLKNAQSTKLLTIYIPNGVEVKSYAELVHLNLEGYHGADDIEHKAGYTKYSPGIFYRNDRDGNGNYIYPKDHE